MIAETPQSQTGLTFDQIWAISQETSVQIKEMSAQMKETFAQMKETDTQLKQRVEETSAQMKEMSAQMKETFAQMKETDTQLKQRIEETSAQMKEMSAEVEKTNQVVKKLSKNIGGVNKSFGRLMEAMYSARLWDKFADFGYAFTCGCQRKKFKENGQSLAEADIFLENGLYVMAVEVKTDLTLEDVDDHLERIATIRGYMDRHEDKRFLVGSVAGGIAPDNVIIYAQKKGLYVVVWSGKAATVAEAPRSFKANEWGQGDGLCGVCN